MADDLKSCHMCGGPKERGRGLRYCESCRELAMWKTTRRHRRKRELCVVCKRPKQPGPGRRLCDACRKAEPPKCRRCGEGQPRAKNKILCQTCFAISLDRGRWRRRKYNRKRRLESAEAVRLEYRAHKQRRAADPEKRARDLELRRLRYRLKAQAEGRTLRRSPVVLVSKKGRLPGRPLAAAIDRLAEFSDLMAVCELAGTAERQVTRWRTGETNVSFEDADRVLTALDLLWWEVWDEESVRLPFFVVTVYTSRLKLTREVHRRVRVKDRAIPYGDAGPDHLTLAGVANLMTGEAVAA